MTPDASPRDSRQLRRDLARYYDQDAPGRALRRLDRERERRRGDFADRLLAAGGTGVLDIGVGPGQDAEAMGRRGVRVTGIDLSREHVRLARERGVDAVVAAAQDLPFADSSFDAIWCVSVLMHLPDDDLREALAEMRRVLVPGGQAALGTWGGTDTEGPHAGDRFQPPRYFSWRSDARIRALIGQLADIQVFETWEVGSPPSTYQWCVAQFEPYR